MTDHVEHRTPLAALIVAWLIVGLPALWGVSQTFMKSLDLFRAPPTAAATKPAPTTATAPAR